MKARRLKMESPEWLKVGGHIDEVINLQDKAVTLFSASKWTELKKTLQQIEAASKKAQKILTP